MYHQIVAYKYLILEAFCKSKLLNLNGADVKLLATSSEDATVRVCEKNRPFAVLPGQ